MDKVWEALSIKKGQVLGFKSQPRGQGFQGASLLTIRVLASCPVKWKSGLTRIPTAQREAHMRGRWVTLWKWPSPVHPSRAAGAPRLWPRLPHVAVSLGMFKNWLKQGQRRGKGLWFVALANFHAVNIPPWPNLSYQCEVNKHRVGKRCAVGSWELARAGCSTPLPLAPAHLSPQQPCSSLACSCMMSLIHISVLLPFLQIAPWELKPLSSRSEYLAHSNCSITASSYHWCCLCYCRFSLHAS